MRISRARLHFVKLEGDTLSPPGATDALAAKFEMARVTSTSLRLPPGKGDPHFRWARQPDALLDVLEHVEEDRASLAALRARLKRQFG